MEEIRLPKPELKSDVSLEETISSRRSVRDYSPEELTLVEIGQLLWASQGITDAKRSLRAARSADALYPLELYLAKNDGVYRYISRRHGLKRISEKNIKRALADASRNQRFVEDAPVDIVICAAYERVTARYGERGVRYTHVEVGHAAQNVHLEAVRLGLSSVPVGAFDDRAISKILNLPKEEKPIYIIPVGHEG